MVSATMNKEFIQSLTILLSCFSSLSDKSDVIKYKILQTELLVHVANVISFFSDLPEDSEAVSL